jgi:hypothetical protein
MNARAWIALPLLTLLFVPSGSPAPACCPAPPSGKPVVNADQTVVILWDAASKTQHFIRQASFKSDAADFGFLVPSPSQPTLDESGNDAFPYLLKLTEPEHKKVPRPTPGVSCGCGGVKSDSAPGAKAEVRVLEQKLVAGFHASVLEADSADALTNWLKEHGYAFSPEVKAWAKPYVDQGWKITALKVAKGADAKSDKTVSASALRISFKTERPLFPYREPDSTASAAALGAKHRLLRIYFVGEGRYTGELTKEMPWTGKVAWAGKLAAGDRKKLLDLLKLPASTGPEECWLTEFEDNWPYKVAPADIYFTLDKDQTPVKRPPIIEYVQSRLPLDATVYTLGAALVLTPLWQRRRRAK